MQTRIRAVRKTNRLTQPEFGAKIGASKDAVANLEYGRVAPSELAILAICRTFHVDYDWLKYGTGEMYADDNDAVFAALDDLMTGDEHSETQSLIKALVELTDDELSLVDKIIVKMKKELGANPTP